MAFPIWKATLFHFVNINYPSREMAIIPLLVPKRGKGKMATLY
jgi:hypothetical protein